MKLTSALTDKYAEMIGKTKAFRGAEKSAVAAVLGGDGVALKEFSKGQVVFPCRSFRESVCLPLVGKGFVKQNGRIVAEMLLGEFYGADCVFGKLKEGFEVVAAGDCKALFLKRSAVEALLEADFSARSSFERLSEKPQETQKQAPEKILARFLLGRARGGGFDLPKDLLKIARLAGLDKAELSAALQALNSAGAVSLGANGLKLDDEEKLKSFI